MKLGIALVMAAALVARPAGAEAPLASMRSIYDIALARTTNGSVIAARGRLAIEFRDTCDGWSTTQRLIMDTTDADGVGRRTDFFVTAWESRDSRTMRFDTGGSRDGKPVPEKRGEATLATDGSGTVEMAGGKGEKIPLPRGTEFPTAQTLEILRVARSGGHAVRHLVFQGGDKTDLNFSTVTIGKAGIGAAGEGDTDRKSLLKHAAYWPVLISFFPVATRAETPDYEIATRLYADGVSGSMSMIYADYALRANLTSVEPLPQSC